MRYTGSERERLRDLRAVVESPQPLDFGLERRRRLLELRFGRDLGERAALAGELGERRLGGRVHEDGLASFRNSYPVVPSTGQSRSGSPGSRIFSTQTCSTPASRSRSR